jgi:cytochrome b
MWGTAELGEMEWHRRAGYLLLASLIFRLIWGLLGSSTARFRNFIRGPRVVWEYARQSLRATPPEAPIGHNPLGAWSVAAMLVLLGVQVGLGLISTDIDGLESGPLATYVDFDTGRAAAEWHEWLFNIVLALIALHIAAILYYAVGRRQNLITPMITGVLRTERVVEPMTPAGRTRLLFALVIAATAAALVATR